jgi:FkbM family methyltransferase
VQAPYLLKKLIYPDRDGFYRLRFRERGGWISALVPDQERFGLARELVLQRIYDIAGGVGGQTVVDAGANVGMFSLVASRHAQRVIAIEPDPINYRVLDLNLNENHVTNVEALNAALWVEDGEISFATGLHATDGAVSSNGHGDLTVNAVSLETIVDRYGDIDLLKLDIEGAEEDVLPAAEVLPRISRIVAELHLSEPDEERPMVEALERAGFEVTIVPASSLYTTKWVRAVLRNLRALERQKLIKLGVLAYLLAPITKPRRPGRDMPLLVATRSVAT